MVRSKAFHAKKEKIAKNAENVKTFAPLLLLFFLCVKYFLGCQHIPLSTFVRAIRCTFSRVTQNYGSYLALFANTGFGAAPIPQPFIFSFSIWQYHNRYNLFQTTF
jgi:hypothetical protein